MKRGFLLSVLAGFAVTAYGQDFYVKRLVFPPDADVAQKIEMASRLVPTRQQYEWQQRELTCFLHFGMNTFTDSEWGDGTEPEDCFNPSALDCEQWVKVLKEAGFKMALLTAKHHDGFCLWPTATTTHSVASSSWKNGKGDVVADLKKACDKYGLKFGIYLSPWDRNASCYGQGKAYNEFFMAQLTELLTRYGTVHEVWFDGANGEGPNGKKQEYDWASILDTIHKLQPQTVTAVMGDDVRWVGNEGGQGRTTEWSATVLAPASDPDLTQNNVLQIDPMSPDLGSRELVAKAGKMYWYPSEVDVSIRPGWFYHKDQDHQVKSLDELVSLYFQSVGCNSVLLLNIPPDTRGLLADNDVASIKALGDYLRATFARNRVSGGNKPWQAASGESKVFRVKPGLVNTFLIQEDIIKGQRVERFRVELFWGGEWHLVEEGTTIGYKRLMRFADSRARKVRVTVLSSRGTAGLCRVGLFFGAD